MKTELLKIFHSTQQTFIEPSLFPAPKKRRVLVSFRTREFETEGMGHDASRLKGWKQCRGEKTVPVEGGQGFFIGKMTSEQGVKEPMRVGQQIRAEERGKNQNLLLCLKLLE